MWKFNKRFIIIIFLCSLHSFVGAQNCDITISGTVKDKSTAVGLAFANIYVKEAEKGGVSDEAGVFDITGICPGDYHISVSHLGCQTLELFVQLQTDTVLTIELFHSSELLNEIVVEEDHVERTTQSIQTINAQEISNNSDENLANMLESVSGVSTIKNGNNIAKPVIHGLSGNRITILNNGIAQSGQQWGADHGPEIDPLSANSIEVVKGVGALEYQGSNLGGLVLIEPGPIEADPHIHGQARYFFASNGLANGINVSIRKGKGNLKWRLGGTLQKSGDNRTADYWLNNTGMENANMNVDLRYAPTKRWDLDFYASTFNANMGVLRGSQVGNITDLEVALQRDEPFYTEKSFSYDIDPPYQQVNHHLAKISSQFRIDERQWIDMNIAMQLDYRKEFDVRRGDRSEIPAMSLDQVTQFGELKYYKYFENEWRLKAGGQFKRIDNTNDPETNILPLIPDYISYETGAFATLAKAYNRTNIEFGARGDIIDRRVASISNSVPREVVRYDEDYLNYALSFGLRHSFSEKWNVNYNIGVASRSPEVNELYSNGLHQGVGGIEEGDPNLDSESSLKNTLSIKSKHIEKLGLEALVYHQYIGNYIYLQPEDELRLTIRGAFPVFSYEQTNASIYGLDLVASYDISDKIAAVAKYSFIQGRDLTNNLYLIQMPANNLSGDLTYQMGKTKKLENVSFQVNGQYVFKRKGIKASQDYLAPPDAYFLLGFELSAEKPLHKGRLRMSLKVENALNTAYRDYLNRQRYFADDLGINAVLGLQMTF